MSLDNILDVLEASYKAESEYFENLSNLDDEKIPVYAVDRSTNKILHIMMVKRKIVRENLKDKRLNWKLDKIHSIFAEIGVNTKKLDVGLMQANLKLLNADKSS